MKYLLWLTGLIFAIATYAATTRTIEGDQIRSSSKIKLWSFPASGDTLAGIAATQTLTNKTISGASNTISNINLGSQVTGTLPISNGGTGQTSKTNAYDALSPNTTTGDITYYNGTDNVRLAAGTAGQVLTSAGVAAPSWQPVTATNQVITYTTTATASSDATVVLVTGASGNWTLSLPSTASVPAGKQYTIIKTDNNNAVTIDPNSTQTIGGFTTAALRGLGSSVIVYNDGSNWQGVSAGGAGYAPVTSRNSSQGVLRYMGAFVTSGTTVSNETEDWINGNCSYSGGTSTCTLSGGYTAIYGCIVTSTSQARPGNLNSFNTSTVNTVFTDLVGTPVQVNYTILCWGY